MKRQTDRQINRHADRDGQTETDVQTYRTDKDLRGIVTVLHRRRMCQRPVILRERGGRGGGAERERERERERENELTKDSFYLRG